MSTQTASVHEKVAVVMKSLPKVQKWKHDPPANADFNSVAISADGSKVVGGTLYFNDNGATPSETVGVFAWKGDGTPLFQADTYQVSALPDSRAGVESVSIAKDGSWLASGGSLSAGVGFVHVYDSAGNKTSLLSPSRAVSAVALSSDGAYLVAGADVLYVFKRTATGWSAPVTVADPSGVVRRVAISDDGQWIATAIDNGWTSLVRNKLATGGTVTAIGKWQVPRILPDPQPYVQNVAVAGDGSAYAAAGANGRVYYFDIATSQNGPLTPRWHYDPQGKSTCRWVAISQDGSHVSAVTSFDPNPNNPNTPSMGKTYLLQNVKNPQPGDPLVKRLWTGNQHTAHGPNAVSMGQTSSGDYFIAVADGTWKTTGGFCLFDSNGDSMWGGPPDHNFPTPDMNYSVAMSADGSAVAGGSNDGRVYYFMVP